MRGDYDDLDSAPETLRFAGELNAFDPPQSEVRGDEVEAIRPQARDCGETVAINSSAVESSTRPDTARNAEAIVR